MRSRKATNGGLNRRDVVRGGVAAGLTAAAGGLAPAIAVAGNEGAGGKTASAPHGELEEITLAELGKGLETGRFTTRSLAEMYAGRIEALDGAGPTLRSILELDPDFLKRADALDVERKNGAARGRPLHGIPVLIKDNIATADGMETTAGSLALLGVKPARDAFLVERLRAAGALILGKTNLSEWANFRSTQSSSGWSGRGGQCRNPYALDRSPCGSSSGTGVAVSANLAAVGIGTETDGSIVCPSHMNSLVGIKPTVGAVSRSGIIPISHTQDTAGPMARTVTDAVLLLQAMISVDPEDPATAIADRVRPAGLVGALRRNALRGARIGVAREGFFGYSPETDAVIEESLQALKDAGAVLVDPADIPNAKEYGEDEWQVLLYEFKADLNAYLKGLGPASTVRSLAELIAFNEAHKDREMPYFGQEIFHLAEEKGPLTEEEYTKALERCGRLSRDEGIDAVMKEERLDALVAPTGAPAWPIDLVNGDHFLGASSRPAAVSGYPSVTVPAGYAFGLPVGLSFIGRAWEDARIVGFAHAFEQATRVRRPPTFLPTADLG